jgi:hypothetical protein
MLQIIYLCIFIALNEQRNIIMTFREKQASALIDLKCLFLLPIFQTLKQAKHEIPLALKVLVIHTIY